MERAHDTLKNCTSVLCSGALETLRGRILAKEDDDSSVRLAGIVSYLETTLQALKGPMTTKELMELVYKLGRRGSGLRYFVGMHGYGWSDRLLVDLENTYVAAIRVARCLADEPRTKPVVLLGKMRNPRYHVRVGG